MKKQTKKTASSTWKLKATMVLAAIVFVWALWPEQKPTKPMQAATPAPQVKVLTQQEAFDAFIKIQQEIHPDLPQNAYYTPFMKERLRWITSEAKVYTDSQGKRGLDFKLILTNPANIGAWVRAFQFGDGIKHIEAFAPRVFAGRDFCIKNYPPNGFRVFLNSLAVTEVHETIHLEEFHPELNTLKEPNDAYYQEESRAWWKTVAKCIHTLRQLHERVDPFFENYDEAYTACHERRPCPQFETLIRQQAYSKQ
jgi:hypothetical protein